MQFSSEYLNLITYPFSCNCKSNILITASITIDNPRLLLQNHYRRINAEKLRSGSTQDSVKPRTIGGATCRMLTSSGGVKSVCEKFLDTDLDQNVRPNLQAHSSKNLTKIHQQLCQ